MVNTKLSAKIIIIGNEILSGKTQDINTNFMANFLTKKGIAVKEVRIIPDIEEDIIQTILELKDSCDFIFTSGGIGPTHDDITSEAIAKALNRKYEINQEAFVLLQEFYSHKPYPFNEARQKMAYMPRGAKLIKNDISTAPGFNIENIYVMAGVPNIMQNMLENLADELPNSEEIYSKTIEIHEPEGNIAIAYGELQKKHPEIEMGSYPFERNGQWCTNLVFRGINRQLIEQISSEFVNTLGISK